MISFPYGNFIDETSVGLGCGYASLDIDTKTAEITLNDFPRLWAELSPNEAIEFVQDNWEEFFQDNPEEIINTIKTLQNEVLAA